MDNVSNAIKCANCELTLSSPVLLPCGHSVCKKHSDNDVNSSIRCGNCGEDHLIPPKSFPENKALSMLIEAKIEKLDFGEFYLSAKSSCRHLNDLHFEIEALLKDPSFFIHQQVSDLKNKIQTKSEELKLQIDNETDRLIEKLTRYEADCKEYSTSNEYIDNAKSLDMPLKESDSKLKHWNESLNEYLNNILKFFIYLFYLFFKKIIIEYLLMNQNGKLLLKNAAKQRNYCLSLLIH